MSLKFDAVERSCWVETIPILEYFCSTKKHKATKEELLQYIQNFRLIEMIDLEERLDFLKNKGLISVFKNIVSIKWFY